MSNADAVTEDANASGQSASRGYAAPLDEQDREQVRERGILFVRLQKALRVLSDATAYLDLLDQRGFIIYGKPGGAEREDVQQAVANARKVLKSEREGRAA